MGREAHDCSSVSDVLACPFKPYRVVAAANEALAERLALELERAKLSVTNSYRAGEYVLSISKLDKMAVDSKLTKDAVATEGGLVL